MECYDMLSFLGLAFTSCCAGKFDIGLDLGSRTYQISPLQLEVNTRARKLTMT